MDHSQEPQRGETTAEKREERYNQVNRGGFLRFADAVQLIIFGFIQLAGYLHGK